MIDHASEMAAFVRVVDSKGFSAAAPSLGLTPSAVSRSLQRLEERLHTRLLYRTTRSVTLTEEGARFHERVIRVLTDLEEAEAEAEELHELLDGD